MRLVFQLGRTLWNDLLDLALVERDLASGGANDDLARLIIRRVHHVALHLAVVRQDKDVGASSQTGSGEEGQDAEIQAQAVTRGKPCWCVIELSSLIRNGRDAGKKPVALEIRFWTLGRGHAGICCHVTGILVCRGLK